MDTLKWDAWSKGDKVKPWDEERFAENFCRSIETKTRLCCWSDTRLLVLRLIC